MSDKKHWIIKIVPALGFVAGIIMASVGGIMTVSSAGKLVLFENGPYSYVNMEQCRYDYNRPVVDKDEKAYERTSEEIDACLVEKKQEELSRFQNREKQDIVDGISALLIGGILLLAFRRRK